MAKAVTAKIVTYNGKTMALTFPKSIVLNFHTAIPLGIELKMNIYKTYVGTNYVLLPGGSEEASKFTESKLLLNKH